MENVDNANPNIYYYQTWNKVAEQHDGWIKYVSESEKYPPLIDEKKKEVRILVGWPSHGSSSSLQSSAIGNNDNENENKEIIVENNEDIKDFSTKPPLVPIIPVAKVIIEFPNQQDL